ncbi:XdhC family protein [Rhodococcus sp. LB1]|uniref:XdhC family protein n=1 Tax=Rhodococcus sp. LB1 TaxID=1807499 RepID=UPI0009EE120A|nr:XdhC/CoxI family protein [Rhodococcus sp. LB1]
MREVITQLLETWSSGQDAALATVVSTYRSAPRQPGAAMLVRQDGSVMGSVSGGCVEADVYAVAADVLAGSDPVVRSYGVPDDDALAVGLTCGGEVSVFIERINRATFPDLEQVADSIGNSQPVAVAVVINGPAEFTGRRVVVWPQRVAGTTDSAALDQRMILAARECLADGRAKLFTHQMFDGPQADQVQVFVDAVISPARLLIFGAIEFAAALVRVGAAAGYQVTVCDARATFMTAERFPDAHQVIVDWPDRYLAGEAAAERVDARTAVCVLTHDPKFDVPVLEVALRLPTAGYIGVMGSRRTHADRVRRLHEAGITSGELERMSSPLGLDIGAVTPAETAISILAEIIATRSGRSGGALSVGAGPIHDSSFGHPDCVDRAFDGSLADGNQGRAERTPRANYAR